MSRRFSVVVPTRDRPHFLSWCLESIAAQTFDDVEVIVSDNAVTIPVRDVFDRWARPGWRYVRPDAPLAMHDNFERGVAEASGEHVAVVIDKTMLHPTALETVDTALRTSRADIATWWNEGYDPVDEAGNRAPGHYRPVYESAPVTEYDCRAELAARFSMAVPRAAAGSSYFRGKIVFGTFARPLLERIRTAVGRCFFPLAPDYTSMVPALLLATGAVDVGRPLILSYNSAISNGRLQSVDPAHARAFIEATAPAIIDRLPIPGLYTSVHNVVAHDLQSSLARCPDTGGLELDLANLARRAAEDLDGVEWTDPAVEVEQRALLAAVLGPGTERAGADAGRSKRRIDGVTASARTFVHRHPTVEWLVRRALGDRVSERFRSPLDAARAADAHYSA